MDENYLEQRLQVLENAVAQLVTRRIGKNNIIPGSINQTHLASGCGVIIFDKAANRPTAGSNFILAFFATDSHVLSLWDGAAWRTQTLT
jgi:hypothetical protein